MNYLNPSQPIRIICFAMLMTQFVSLAHADLGQVFQDRTIKIAKPTASAKSTSRVVLTLPANISSEKFAKSNGLKIVGTMVTPPNTYIFDAKTVLSAEKLIARFRSKNYNATMDKIMPIVRDTFVPNDTYFNINTPASPWPGQWYLKKTGTAIVDINIEPAWNLAFTGTGIVIGLVDDGFEITHPDLSANYSAANSFDFGQNDSNPSPVTSLDVHGTAMAGTIAARGGNSLGITGVAPFASWAGLRVDFDGTATNFASQTANATSYRSSASLTNIKIKNHSYSLAAPFVTASLQVNALLSSGAVGTIHVHSAGNGRGSSNEDANKQAEKVQTPVIVVSAMDRAGKVLPSSSFGANIAVSVPTHDPSVAGSLSFLTTDRTTETNGYNGGADTFPDANYTSLGGFTSSAAALVSGALGVVEQAQPNLDNRFAKHLLSRTSTIIDIAETSQESDGGWKTNQAGIRHNQNYGWGLLNVGAMVSEATKWAGVTTLASANPTFTVNAAIPDGNLTGITRTINFSGATTPLEEVQLALNITHPYRGDLEAYVTSPGGTTSRMFIQAGSDDGDNISWTFTSLAFWGENPVGQWTVRVVDTFALDTGTWTNAGITFRQGRLFRNFNANVNLQNWIPGNNGQTVNVLLKPVGGGTNINRVETLDSAGNFSFTHEYSGNYDVFIKKSHWLQRVSSNVNFTNGSVNAGSFSLINGDIDNDNFIGLDDFNVMSDSFNLGLDDVGYQVNADLDGDDFVGLDDFNVLSDNFNVNGDE